MYFQSVPDDGRVTVRAAPNGGLDYQWPNQLILSDEIRQAVLERGPAYYYSVARHAPWPNPAWVVNTSTDADTYRNALIWLDEMAGEVPVFNHPRAVAQSRRDLSAARLDGIEGLTVPQCKRFRLDSDKAAQDAFEAGGFDYPVLVRPHSGQAGIGLVRIDRPQDWEALARSRWFGQIHYMIQFVDFATPAREYLKCRLMIAGSKVMVRHIKANAGWNVHNNTIGSIDGFEDRELEIIDRVEASQTVLRIGRQIAARARLDFAGIDIGLDLDRERFVLFECNPSMTAFFKQRPDITAKALARRIRLQNPLDVAILSLVRRPDLWHSTIAGFRQDLPPCREVLAGTKVIDPVVSPA